MKQATKAIAEKFVPQKPMKQKLKLVQNTNSVKENQLELTMAEIICCFCATD